jgi:hypothetical protein
VIRKAQGLPAEVAAGAAERIFCLKDRVWFKIKIGQGRGAATELDPAAMAAAHLGGYIGRGVADRWLGTIGMRQKDSAQRDFYAQLETAGSSSDHLLPTVEDVQRLGDRADRCGASAG